MHKRQVKIRAVRLDPVVEDGGGGWITFLIKVISFG